MVAAKTAPELRHNAVGLGPVIFQSLTVVAPAAGVATAHLGFGPRRGHHGHVRDSSDRRLGADADREGGTSQHRRRLLTAHRQPAWPQRRIHGDGLGLYRVLACANGAGNSGSRMLFSPGRVGGLPSSLANIDKKRGNPYFAIRVISISGIITAVGLGFIIGGPLNVFAVYATAITILFVVGYMLVAVSFIRYSVREPERSGNFLLRYVVPACAFLVFVPVLLASLGIPFLETQALQEP